MERKRRQLRSLMAPVTSSDWRQRCVPATRNDSTMHSTICPVACPVAIVSAFSTMNTQVTANTPCRVSSRTSSPAPPDIAVICHSMKAEMPSTVAAPLPPLNLSTGVKSCVRGLQAAPSRKSIYR